MNYIDLLLTNKIRAIMVFDGFSSNTKRGIHKEKVRIIRKQSNVVFLNRKLVQSLSNRVSVAVFSNQKES